MTRNGSSPPPAREGATRNGPTPRGGRPTLALGAILVASGFAGLGYQVVWTRVLSVGLGHEAHAALAVVAAFFAGLAVGGLALDGLVARSRRPGRLYAGLEIAIGLWALALIWLAPWAEARLAQAMGPEPSELWRWSVAFAGVAALLAPATIAMGATLPAAERLAARLAGEPARAPAAAARTAASAPASGPAAMAAHGPAPSVAAHPAPDPASRTAPRPLSGTASGAAPGPASAPASGPTSVAARAPASCPASPPDSDPTSVATRAPAPGPAAPTASGPLSVAARAPASGPAAPPASGAASIAAAGPAPARAFGSASVAASGPASAPRFAADAGPASEAADRPDAAGRGFGRLGALYAANTAGAMAGALATAFVLAPALGYAGTLALFAALNFACAAALLLGPTRDARAAPAQAEPATGDAQTPAAGPAAPAASPAAPAAGPAAPAAGPAAPAGGPAAPAASPAVPAAETDLPAGAAPRTAPGARAAAALAAPAPVRVGPALPHADAAARKTGTAPTEAAALPATQVAAASPAGPAAATATAAGAEADAAAAPQARTAAATATGAGPEAAAGAGAVVAPANGGAGAAGPALPCPAADPTPAGATASPGGRRGALAALAATGLLGVGYEVAAVRALTQVLQNTVYSFACALAAFLLCMALGAALHARLARGRDAARGLLRLTAAAAALGLPAALAVKAAYADAGAWVGVGGPASALAEFAAALAVLGPAAAAMGALFAELAPRARGRAGGLGAAFAANTAGAALAPAVVGVLAIPALGPLATMAALATGYLALAAAFPAPAGAPAAARADADRAAPPAAPLAVAPARPDAARPAHDPASPAPAAAERPPAPPTAASPTPAATPSASPAPASPAAAETPPASPTAAPAGAPAAPAREAAFPAPVAAAARAPAASASGALPLLAAANVAGPVPDTPLPTALLATTPLPAAPHATAPHAATPHAAAPTGPRPGPAARPGRRLARRLAPPTLAALAVAAAAAFAPAALRLVDAPPGGAVLAHREGVAAAVSVLQEADGARRMVVDARQVEGGDATFRLDRAQGHLALLRHPAPRRALFLGVGAGATLAAAAAWPDLQATGVELLPEALDLIAEFPEVARDLSPGGPVRLVAADARRWVRAGSEPFDVIVADNFHPARDGAAHLYTVEHFAAVRARLAPGGVFVQWLPLHQLDIPTLKLILRSYLAVFPDARLQMGNANLGTPLLALSATVEGGAPALDALLRQPGSPALRDALAASGLGSPFAVFGGFLAGPQALAAFAGAGPLNTDDRPRVAHLAPRTVYAPLPPAAERLLALVAALPRDPTDAVDVAGVPGGAAFHARLGAYWRARDQFLTLGARARLTGDPAEDALTLGPELLGLVRLSPDFAPAYDPLLAMAGAAARTDPELALDLLAALTAAHPGRPDAARLRATLLRLQGG